MGYTPQPVNWYLKAARLYPSFMALIGSLMTLIFHCCIGYISILDVIMYDKIVRTNVNKIIIPDISTGEKIGKKL